MSQTASATATVGASDPATLVQEFSEGADPTASEYAILQAVVHAATAFLQTSEVNASLNELLARIGAATNASRVYVFENEPMAPGEAVFATQCAEWTAPGVTPYLGTPTVTHVSLNTDGLEAWYDGFAHGTPWVVVVSDLPDPARSRLHAAGVLSMAAAPIFVDSTFYGFIGVDNCVSERHWSAVEVDALSAAAVVVGAAIRRHRVEAALREATLQAQLAADIGDVVTRAGDTLQQMLDLCSEAIMRRLNPDMVRIWMMSESLDCLLACTAAGAVTIQHSHSSEMLLITDALLHVAASSEPTFWRDNVPQLWPGCEQEFKQAGITAGVGYPLVTNGRVAGVMVLLGREFPARQMIDALESVTDEIALAIERHHAQGGLTRAETRYRRLVEATVEGIVIHDGVQVVDANPSFSAMMGFSYDEVIGRNPMSFIAPEYHEFVREMLAMKYEKPYEAEAVCKDGRRFPAEIKGTQVDDGSRELRVAAVRDISDRKAVQDTTEKLREEQQARELAERTRAQAEFLAEASRVLAASLDTNTTLTQLAHLAIPTLADYCIVSVTENGTQRRVAIVHKDPEKEPLLREVIDKHPAMHDRNNPIFTALAAGRHYMVREMSEPIIRQMGVTAEHRPLFDSLGPTSVMAVPIHNSGRIMGSIMLASTRQERLYGADDLALAREFAHRAALALLSSESFHAAQAATRARDEMLAVVAHDLRNPLNTIFMGSELALEIISEETSALGVKQLQIIRRSAEQMNRLIQDLLEASRIDSGNLSLEKALLGATELLREASDMLAPLAAHQKIAFVMQPADGLPLVEADKGRLLQVLSNLVGNALKFTPSGGSVTVSAQTETDSESDTQFVRFSVRDTGAGIPAEQLPHIFARGWQARRGDRRGIGVGLAIASGIVEAHGGRIWVESKVGEGSTFLFTVPAAT